MLRIAIIATLWTTACTGDDALAGYAPDGRVWRLEAIDGSPFDARATLAFAEDGSIRGQAPCNIFGGSLARDYPAFGIGAMRTTRSLCSEIAAERAFFAALGAMDRAEISSGRMVLTSAVGGEMIFGLDPQP